ncbi:MAG: hypothetical protein NTW28_04730 [Candidatus Solibacter sp.]|nr:hypothetical protein [Candidatus Solibacter sp.]
MNRLLPAAAAFWLAGCGYVGDPLPPLANIPSRVIDLAAMQRGSRIIVRFTVPASTTEGHPIAPPLQLDLRAGKADHFEENQWAAGRVSGCDAKTGQEACPTARYEIPAADWTGKEVIFGVRAVGGNGKHSGWSDFVVVPVVTPPEKPGGLATATALEGVRLTWQARGTDFRVFRKTGEGGYAPAGNVQKPEWTDTATEFGKVYTYVVQTIVKLDNRKEAESELSDEASVIPRDIFPPAAPKGVQAASAPNSIELNWEGNSEGDLSGYRVYRGEGNGALEKIADVSAVPSYSDRRVEHGKTYRYAIAAVDQTGNEGPRSAPVEVTLP